MTAATRTVVRSHGVGVYRATERHILRTSDKGRRDASRIGVIALHGVTASATFVDLYPVANELASRSYLVVGVDAGGTTTWGNDASLAAVSDARTWLLANGAAAGQVVLLGASMGSVVGLNWLRANPTLVACAQFALPIPDVEAVRAANRGGLQAGIETAYTNNAGWQAARPTHNPVEYQASLVGGAPVRLDYSTDDTIGLPAEATDFAADVDVVEAYSMGAVGHTYTSIDKVAVADWVEANI
jgi:pimeloyl-ACP methyl ester carboxylesterase